jgi:hypothetical protein
MRTKIFKITFFVCMATFTIASCSSSTEQKTEALEKAQANVEEASQNLDLARADSAEYANYKIESEKTLRGNELLIADMKDRMKSEKKESMAEYKETLDSLGIQNSRLRSNLQMYSAEGKARWNLFKEDFNKELDALGKAISQLSGRSTNKG